MGSGKDGKRTTPKLDAKIAPGIHVTPIGFESFGVRSMCTFVETPDVRVLIDAGVALGPRFGKLPHPREYQARNLCRAKIRDCAEKADVIIVSHYHNDHHTPNYTETVWLGSSAEIAESIYRDKVVLAKDVRNAINFSQRRRGWMFQRFVKKLGSEWEVADGRIFEYGATKLKFSRPVPHGEEKSGLGWIIMTTISRGEERILHASDVQGPMSKKTLRMILKERAKLVIVGGPPLYLEGVKVKRSAIDKGIENASRIAAVVPATVFEHHVLRTENWKEQTRLVYDLAKKAGHEVVTAAEYSGVKPQLLESMRQRLYQEDPPSEEFLRWTQLLREKQRREPPPV